MPPRISRSSVAGSQPSKPRSIARNWTKAKKRAHNAFAIAQYENPEKLKIRRGRLGELEQTPTRKRTRDDEDDEDDQDSEEESAVTKRRKNRSGEDSFDEGSDSDGNTWQMGHVNEDDDEDIDSDEAFGESDEERFEGFTFRGSSKPQKGEAKKGKKVDSEDEDMDVDLDEDKGFNSEEEEEDDDLGEDAIDLATALDQYEEDEAERKSKKKRKTSLDDDAMFSSEEDDYAADDASEHSSESEDEESDRQAQLTDLISSLATQEPERRGRKREVHESIDPDEFAVMRKVDFSTLKSKTLDAEKKKSLKLLSDDKSSKRKDIARKLDAPLPKRQQDKLDRAAANAKANETLDRWTDTIKQNRRAEHLIFPLQNKSGGDFVGEKVMLPTTTTAPANDLESTIQSILQQSGLSSGKNDEEQIRKWEELQTNKLPIEEVMKRRAQLRMERELLFREEVRAKRIKKIKSKAYRRVHRKERERLLEKEQDQLKADGVDLSEEEREYNDRRRAEERMGAKHRESKWAKGIKATGRAAWDQDALDGVTEMARRNEELRRRVEGRSIRDEDDPGSDFSSEDDESDDPSDNETLQHSLGKLKQNPFSTNGNNSGLGQMAFMQKAENARRKQNDEAVEQMRRELAGEDSVSEEGDENSARTGRKKYGPGNTLTMPDIQGKRNEFEEHPGSDDEERPAKQSTQTKDSMPAGISNGTRPTKKTTKATLSDHARASAPSTTEDQSGSANPFLMKAKKDKSATKEPTLPSFPDNTEVSVSKPSTNSSKTKSTPQATSKPAASQPNSTVDSFLQQRVTTTDSDGWATVLGDQDSSDNEDTNDLDEEEDGIDLTSITRNRALTAKGFAGDNVAADFASEKALTITEEAASEETSYLPGWGAWVGSGLSKREAARSKGARTITKKEGIDASKRKDRKLDRVIINEKRVRQNVKYMASQVPFPYESREQYERSLRVPKGKEWTTKQVFQENTRPRVIVKQGVIRPLRKPLV